MKTTIKKIHVKATNNGGDDCSYDTKVVVFKDIQVRFCGCGGSPIIIQSSCGRPMYDYSGETFNIGCVKCGNRGFSLHNGNYSNIDKFNKDTIKIVEKLISKWNKCFGHRNYNKINFTTNC